MHMPRRVIAFPRDEDVPAPPIPAHRTKMLPYEVTFHGWPVSHLRANRSEDKDLPMSWIKPHGKGRVVYTALGHYDYAFWNQKLLEHMLAGIQYALGDLPAADTPNLGVKVP